MEELGRIERSAEGVQLQITRRLAASVDEAWSALTERDALTGWLGRVRYEPRVGSALTIDFGEGVAIYGRVLALEPPRRFAFTWYAQEGAEDASIVEFYLEPVGPMETTLVLTHTRQTTTMVRRTAAGWHAHLDLLMGYLAGKTPSWDDVYPAARAAYSDRVETL